MAGFLQVSCLLKLHHDRGGRSALYCRLTSRLPVVSAAAQAGQIPARSAQVTSQLLYSGQPILICLVLQRCKVAMPQDFLAFFSLIEPTCVF